MAGQIKPPMWCPGIVPVGHRLRDGLVANWPMWTGSGNTAMDVVGSGYHGTLSAGAASPTWISSPYGHALGFDGGDDVQIGLIPTLNSDIMSISFWWRPGGDYTTFQALMACAEASSVCNWAVLFGLADNKLEFANVASGTCITSTMSFSDDSWHHSVFTRGPASNKALSLYIDGVLDGTDTAIAVPASQVGTTVFGEWGAWGGAQFTGALAGVAFWNRCLCAGEAELLCREPWVLNTPPDRLAMWMGSQGGGAPPTGHPYYYNLVSRQMREVA